MSRLSGALSLVIFLLGGGGLGAGDSMLFQLLTADGDNAGVNSDTTLAQLENKGASDIPASTAKNKPIN